MTALLLAEQLFLLSHDDTGHNRAVAQLDYAFAGALLLDLATDGHLAADGRRLVTAGSTPEHPLLAAAHAEIAGDSRGRRADQWISGLARALKPLGRRVGESLVQRGVLAEEQDAVLGVFTRSRWPERDPEPERQLRAELAAVLVGGADPAPRTGLLIGLVEAVVRTHRLVAGDLEPEQRRAALSRARDIGRAQCKGSGITATVTAAVRRLQ